MAGELPASSVAADPVPSTKSRRLRVLLLWIVPPVAALLGYLWFASQARYASTDNAYLKADKTAVAPEVSGTIKEVPVHENDRVAVGQPLLVLTDESLRLAVASAEAQRAAARTAVEAMKATYRQKQSELDVATRDAAYADRELQRQRGLAQQKLIALSRLDEAERAADAAHGSLTVLRSELDEVKAQLAGRPDIAVKDHPDVQAAEAAVGKARLDLGHAAVLSPRAGIVSKVPQVGDHVEAGRAALAIVSDTGLWIEANFKETDLQYVRIGQPVRVRIDTYSGHDWQGHVLSIAQATGAEFALLPPQNASGNWVKVVQRVPLRIALDPSDANLPLRAGMSAEVRIDTGPRSLWPAWLGGGRPVAPTGVPADERAAVNR